MPTIQQVVTRSMRLIGAVEAGETPTTDELTDCVTALCSMINGWRTRRLLAYAFQHDQFAFVANQGTYTIGPSGANWTAARPLKVHAAYTRNNGIDYPMQEIDAYRWSAIADKSTGADYPSFFNYEATNTSGTFKVSPAPQSPYAVFLVRRAELDDTLALADTLDFPPGYERAIVYNLAVEIAPEFEAKPSALVMGIAEVSLADIMRANTKQIAMQPEFTLRGGRGYDIVGDV